MEIFTKGKKNNLKIEFKVNLLKKKLKNKKDNVYLIFDLDGVLVPAGIETPVMKKTLDEFFKETKKEIAEFKKELLKLKKKGFKIGINTGRGVVFARRIVREMFPQEISEQIICEGGVIILEERVVDRKFFERRVFPGSIKMKSINLLERFKGDIITHALKKLEGKLEGGKEFIISLNAPKNQKIEDFYKDIKKYIEKIGLKNKIEISYSATAVDITPKGADKLKALKEILGEDSAFYFGDAPSDEDAMKISIGNIAPANATESTKKRAMKADIGILPEEKHIFGVVEALKIINKLFK